MRLGHKEDVSHGFFAAPIVSRVKEHSQRLLDTVLDIKVYLRQILTWRREIATDHAGQR